LGVEKFAPAAASSASAFRPLGAFPPGGGGFENTIGNTFLPSIRRVPVDRSIVTVLIEHRQPRIRTGFADWSLELADGQIAAQRALLDAAGAHGLRGWLWLGGVPNLPRQAGSTNEQLLVKIVNALKASRAGRLEGDRRACKPVAAGAGARGRPRARLPAAQGARP
jgi:hypothetical protein